MRVRSIRRSGTTKERLAVEGVPGETKADRIIIGGSVAHCSDNGILSLLLYS